jgi:hypothetical protein
MGIEPPPESPEKSSVLSEGGAESGAPTQAIPTLGTDLAEIVSAWPKLPEAIRAGILALIRAAG